jgi:hypothetical protein
MFAVEEAEILLDEQGVSGSIYCDNAMFLTNASFITGLLIVLLLTLNL